MMMQKIRATMIVAVLGGALALAPVAAAHASVDKTTKHHAAKKKPAKKKPAKKKGSSSSGSIGGLSCTDYTNYQNLDSSLGSKFVSAFESGNLAAIKTAMSQEETAFTKDAGAIESHFGGAPSNVRAAFNVLVNDFKQLTAEIEAATSMTTVESDFEGFGTQANLKTASATLSAYYDAQCHVTPTTVSVPSVP